MKNLGYEMYGELLNFAAITEKEGFYTLQVNNLAAIPQISRIFSKYGICGYYSDSNTIIINK